jgi:hypothetical protein
MLVISSKPAIVREEKDLDSPLAGEIQPGTKVSILETVTMPDGSVRARSPLGWLTQAKNRVSARVHFLREVTEEELLELGGLTDLSFGPPPLRKSWDALSKPREKVPAPDRNVVYSG